MEVNLGKIPFDLVFHPSSPLFATGLISGDLHLYQFAADSQPQRLLEIRAHDESCRAARFVDSGRVILTASADCSILATDVETGNPIVRQEDAHEDPVNRLVNLTENCVATGDDEGCIKVWDTRERTCCNSFDAHEDYISDMTFVSSSMQLLATSGDGTLSVCDLRKNKIKARSEFSEDEPLSIVTMKNGKKVICGTQTGALLLYSWGYFKDCRFSNINVALGAMSSVFNKWIMGAILLSVLTLLIPSTMLVNIFTELGFSVEWVFTFTSVLDRASYQRWSPQQLAYLTCILILNWFFACRPEESSISDVIPLK